MIYVLALSASLFYGAADFMGGLASRRAPALAVVVWSQLLGMLVVLAAMPLLPDAFPARADLAWGAAAGLAGGTGVALLYRALAVAPMSVVAPVTAVLSIAVPVLAGLVLGERPGITSLVGVALAIGSIVLVSRAPADSSHGGAIAATPAATRKGLLLALAAGVAVGAFYVALGRTAAEAGLWPLVAARVMSVGLFGTLALSAGRTLNPGRAAWPLVVGGAVLDMLANILYLLAVRDGMMSVVATLSSLYPGVTILLAAVLLRERLARVQIAGLAAAAGAILLIAGH